MAVNGHLGVLAEYIYYLIGNTRAQRQDNAKDLWTLVATLPRDYENLRRRILRTGATIVWKDTARAMTAADEEEDCPHLADIDTLQSTIAALFAILRHFPTRFRSYTETPDKPEEFIWGFSHEDWFRANVCLQRHLARRTKQVSITKKDTTGGIEGWPGFVRDAVEENERDRDEEHDPAILRALAAEHDILGGNWDDEMAGGGENLASKPDIAVIFGDDIAGAYSYDSTLVK